MDETVSDAELIALFCRALDEVEVHGELDQLNYCCVISERATEAAFAREHVKHRLKGSNSKDEKTSIEENQI